MIADAQTNLTMSLGYGRPDDLSDTLSSIMQDIIDDKSVDVSKSILHHDEGVDLFPSNIELSGLEVRLINAIIRESVPKTCINEMKKNYDMVLLRSVSKVKRQINSHLRIDGILMTMVMPHTNILKEITATVKSAYPQRWKTRLTWSVSSSLCRTTILATGISYGQRLTTAAIPMKMLWNGEPALLLGVPASAVIWKAALSRNFPSARTV